MVDKKSEFEQIEDSHTLGGTGGKTVSRGVSEREVSLRWYYGRGIHKYRCRCYGGRLGRALLYIVTTECDS